MIIGAFAMGAREGHVYVRQEYPLAVERITRATRAGARARAARRGDPRQRASLRRAGQPRRRGVRLRRGERHDGLARGPARRAAPAPHPPLRDAASGTGPPTSTTSRPGPTCPHIVLKGADWFSLHRHRRLHGHQDLLARRQGQQHRPRRGADGHDPARDRLRHRRRRPRRQGVQGRPDRRSVRAAACRRTSSTCRSTSTRSWPRAP